jgi:hypothetical protein
MPWTNLAVSRFYTKTGLVEIRVTGLGTNGSSNHVRPGRKGSLSFSCSSNFRGLDADLSA